MRTIAVYLLKGGSGKSTLAVNLAHGLALAGKSVALVDMDIQNQAAKMLGVNPDKGLADLVEHGDKTAVIQARPNLWLLAGGKSLLGLRNYLSAKGDPLMVRKALTPKKRDVDYILYDMPPGFDALTINALCAVDEIIVPVPMYASSFQGLQEFLDYIDDVKGHNPALKVSYIVPMMFEKRLAVSMQFLEMANDSFPKLVTDPISKAVKVAESVGFGKTIFEYAPSSQSAAEFKGLTARVVSDEK